MHPDRLGCYVRGLEVRALVEAVAIEEGEEIEDGGDDAECHGGAKIPMGTIRIPIILPFANEDDDNDHVDECCEETRKRPATKAAHVVAALVPGPQVTTYWDYEQ